MAKKTKSEINVYTLGIGATARGVGNVGPFGIVSLTRMKKPGAIGITVDDKNTVGPTARILFSTATSVEALIAELKPVARKIRAWDREMAKAAKKSLRKMKDQGTEIIFNASVNNSSRRSNKQRSVSRTRTKR